MDSAKARRKADYDRKRVLGLCMKCTHTLAKSGMSLCQKHLDKARVAISDRNLKIKSEAFETYGGIKCACLKCPQRAYSMLSMLTIDHIDGGGNRHRKEIGQDRGGVGFYRWLKKNGWPHGYQVMCWNCNLSKRYGPCEHVSSLNAS